MFAATYAWGRNAGPAPGTCYTPFRSYFGDLKLTSMCLDSFVVNGRGQYRNQKDPTKGLFSIGERFLIPKDAESFELRLINSGFEMLSAVTRLDGRSLRVTATDGRDLQPLEGDVLFLGVGETFNIEIDMSLDAESVFLRFWLPVDHFGPEDDNVALHEPYLDVEFTRDSSVEEGDYKSELFTRKPDDPILKNNHENQISSPIWLNCPFPEEGVVCKTLSDFKRLESSDHKFAAENSENVPSKSLQFDEPHVILTVHVNFNTVGPNGGGGRVTLNGIHFVYPSAPLLNGTEDQSIVQCSEEQMQGAGGECTQILTAKVGDLVELRLSNLEERKSRRTYHSMHLHGYEFFLMSMGFAQYAKNGTIIGDNINVKCQKTPCAFLDYDEEVLRKEREERTSYIAKNSILVPPQGYAIVRFRASNPGIWPIHCHQGVHLDGGMSALIEIKDEIENRPFSYLPTNFPRCGNFEPKAFSENFDGSSALSVHLTLFLLLILKLFS